MFRFTIRDVLLLTVIVALAVGWWAERSIYISELRKTQQGWYECLQREHP